MTCSALTLAPNSSALTLAPNSFAGLRRGSLSCALLVSRESRFCCFGCIGLTPALFPARLSCHKPSPGFLVWLCRLRFRCNQSCSSRQKAGKQQRQQEPSLALHTAQVRSLLQCHAPLVSRRGLHFSLQALKRPSLLTSSTHTPSHLTSSTQKTFTSHFKHSHI